MPLPAVHAVSSRRRLAPDARTTHAEVRALTAWIAELVEAQVDVVQIREPDLPAAALVDVARAAVVLAAGRPTRIVVNDRADVALAAGADGVHLPGRGLPVSTARRLRSDWILGRSVHGEDDPGAADGADYVFFGTVFRSRSKPDDAQEPAGVEGLAAAVLRYPCPVVAIGGLTPDGARACRQVGAAGIAAIGVFLPEGTEPEALGPSRAAAAFRAALETPPPAAPPRSGPG